MEKLITTFVLVTREQEGLPAKCYQVCDNCLEEAVNNGKQANCPADSPFSVALSECESCISVNANGPTIIDQVLPSISLFISYCLAHPAASTTAPTFSNASITSTVSTVSLPEERSILSAESASLSSAQQSLQSQGAEFNSQRCVNAASYDSQLGISLDFSSCVHAISSHTISSSPSPTFSPPATTETNKGTGTNQSTIIGAAVGGSVGGLALLALLVFSIFRRRRKQRRNLATAQSPHREYKAQLHSDDIKPPRQEIEGDKVVPRAGWSETLAELPESPKITPLDTQATT